jgi:hypothetical protein
MGKGSAILLQTTGFAITNVVVGLLFDYAYTHGGISNTSLLGAGYVFGMMVYVTIGFTIITSLVYAIVNAIVAPRHIGRLPSERLFLAGCYCALFVLLPVIVLLLIIR